MEKYPPKHVGNQFQCPFCQKLYGYKHVYYTHVGSVHEVVVDCLEAEGIDIVQFIKDFKNKRVNDENCDPESEEVAGSETGSKTTSEIVCKDYSNRRNEINI